MSKNTSEFVCVNCGYKSARWQGKCPECNEWSSFEEKKVVLSAKGGKRVQGGLTELIKLDSIEKLQQKRMPTGSMEVDTVLGGGLVVGSLVLLGGDPGIGKSTLSLQIAVNLQSSGKSVIYVAGEESPYQIKMREIRLGKSNDLAVLPETNLEMIIEVISREKPDVVVIDSIQTLYSELSSGVTGGVSQIVYSTNTLMRFAKSSGTAIVIIGHVTKEGVLAGPKTLEHMVDAVLYLEGERYGSLRMLRCIKNRFGSVGEVGVFEMRGDGLFEVDNPSGLFLEGASLGKPGTCVTCVLEGNKALIIEVQALVSKASFGYPKRTVSGFDSNRLQLILAILEKYAKLPLSSYDVYINVTGGYQLSERASDFAVAIAVITSLLEKSFSKTSLAFGELGLSGEIRGVSQSDKRVKEARKLGFHKIFTGASEKSRVSGKMEDVVICKNIYELVEQIKKNR